MSATKHYFYMRLVDNFYERPEIKIIEKMENGYQYITILLKMYLRSMKTNGALIYSEDIPYEVPTLSAAIGHEQAIVHAAIKIFSKFKLIEIVDDGTIYMSHIQNFIGKSSSEADRIRQFRAEIAEKSTNVQQLNGNRTPEYRVKSIEYKVKNKDKEYSAERKAPAEGFVEIRNYYSDKMKSLMKIEKPPFGAGSATMLSSALKSHGKEKVREFIDAYFQHIGIDKYNCGTLEYILSAKIITQLQAIAAGTFGKGSSVSAAAPVRTIGGVIEDWDGVPTGLKWKTPKAAE